jgi:hypothetical protein
MAGWHPSSRQANRQVDAHTLLVGAADAAALATRGGDERVKPSNPKLVGNPPSREALKLAYEYIITHILPRMVEGDKRKSEQNTE